MQIETLLPLGKTDPGLRLAETMLEIGRVVDDARLVEALGYDGLVVEETKDDPYVVAALAAQATMRLRLSTAVAMAFPRSPTITALSAWTLQKLSRGRFTLGLGSQVRGHIERRYGVRWSAPVPWMREYVAAVRAVWDCWQRGTPLEVKGPHYRINLMVPLFNPGPIEHPDIPVHLAAVNRLMCRVAGEVADGVRPHPVCTPKYIREVMLPASAWGEVFRAFLTPGQPLRSKVRVKGRSTRPPVRRGAVAAPRCGSGRERSSAAAVPAGSAATGNTSCPAGESWQPTPPRARCARGPDPTRHGGRRTRRGQRADHGQFAPDRTVSGAPQ
jgi:hypothetical protein